jgi:hypothetical protein
VDKANMQEPSDDSLKELIDVYRNTIQLAQKLVEVNADLNANLNKAVLMGEKISALLEKENNG